MNKKIKYIIMLLFIVVLALLVLFFPVYQYKFETHLHDTNLSNAQKYQTILKAPVRDRLHPKVHNFLLEHKVYLSLTTSPERLKHISTVLSFIDQRNIDTIFLVIPEKFSRTNKPYDIPAALVQQFPKLKILKIKQDLGPITKLIPAVEYVKKRDLESILITIDDDTAYPFGMINELIHFSVLTNVVVGGKMERIQRKKYAWKSKVKNGVVDFFHRNIFYHYPGLRKRDFVIGFGAVAYPVKHVDTQAMRKAIKLDKTCFQSDDLVISYVLAKNNIPVAKIANQYLNTNYILTLPYAANEDALHQIKACEEKYYLCNQKL